MRTEHPKEWLTEAQKEEAVAVKTSASEGKVKLIRGPGGGGMDKKREMVTEAMTHW